MSGAATSAINHQRGPEPNVEEALACSAGSRAWTARAAGDADEQTRISLRAGAVEGRARLPAAVLSATSACGGDDALAPRCEAPYSVCDGVCVALHADPEHCGACGQECPAGAACVQGACEPLGTGGDGGDGGGGGGGDGGGPSECREGRYVKRCGDECVDTRTDPDHCGKCGAQCPPGRACAGSTCRPICLAGLTDCAGSCVGPRRRSAALRPAAIARCDPGRPCEGGTCACSAEPSRDIGSAVPQRVSGTTLGADDSRWLTCSGPGAADRAFLFTAPRAGTYLFDTFEASYDTALGALRADTCEELACNDNAGSVQSQISVDLAEGERILVVVSGARGAQGDFMLRVAEPGPVQCAPTVLDPVVPQTVTGTTALREDTVSATCDISATPDATYSFTAPSNGTYVFSAHAPSDLDRRGPRRRHVHRPLAQLPLRRRRVERVRDARGRSRCSSPWRTRPARWRASRWISSRPRRARASRSAGPCRRR